MSEQFKNPFVGPRFFEEDDKEFFFGRDKEARQLKSLVIAERFVLFYAQSGAGKSSLLNTRLIPGLREEDFQVLHTARVGHALPEGMSAGDVDNVFIYNLIMSLDAGEPDPSSHVKTNLPDYLRAFRQEHRSIDEFGDEKARLLIVDQFEEIVTTHLDRWGDREAFFRQLTAAMLDDPLLWILLTLREDYLAAVEAYARMIPGGMRKRFYMERMKAAAALKAIEGPARRAGRPFTSAAAKQLTDNLRQLRTTIGETESSGILGEYVQPVQLQVVCYQLWENLNAQPDPPAKITVEHLERYGDVDVALSQFYEEAVAKVLAETDESELALRNWFERELITEAGTRGTVYQGPDKTAGMDNEVVRLLANQYLLRAESRAGGLWFELVHDRFVEPILEANQEWRLEQNPLTQSAEEWDRSGRDRDLLLLGDGLKTTLAIVDWNNLEPVVQDYLTESKEAQSLFDLEETKRFAAEQADLAGRKARTLRQMRVLAGALVVAILVAVLFAVVANRERNEAQTEAERANAAEVEAKDEADRANAAENEAISEALRAGRAEQEAKDEATRANAAEEEAVEEALRANEAEQDANKQAAVAEALRLASSSSSALNTNPQLALLLAIEAGRQAETEDVVLTAVDRALRQSLDLAQVEAIISTNSPVSQLAVNDAGNRYAFTGDDGRISIRSVSDNQEIDFFDESGEVIDLHFVPEREDLIVALTREGVARVIAIGSNSGHRTFGLDNPLSAIAISPDGKILVGAFRIGGIERWSIPPAGQAIEEEPIELPSVELSNLAFTPDGQWLAGSGVDQTLYVWSWKDLGAAPIQLKAVDDILEMAISPDGNVLANTTADSRVQIWATDNMTFTRPPESTELSVPGFALNGRHTLVFNGDGTKIAAAGSSGVHIWSTGHLDEPPQFIPINGRSIANSKITFNQGGDYLAFLGGGDRVELWHTETGTLSNTFSGHAGSINDFAILGDGSRLLTASDDRTLRIWLTAVTESNPLSGIVQGTPFHIDTSPDGSLLSIVTIREDLADPNQLSTQYLFDTTLLRSGASGSEALVATIPYPEFVLSLDFTRDGKVLVACTGEESVEIGNDTTLKSVDLDNLIAGQDVNDATLQAEALEGFCLSPPQFSPDGSSLLVVTLRGNESGFASGLDFFDVTVLSSASDPDPEVPIKRTFEANFIVFDALFSPDGRSLLFSEYNFFRESANHSSIDLQTLLDGGIVGAEISNLPTTPNIIGLDELLFQTMLISPDGKYLVTFSGEDIFEAQSIVLWNFADLFDNAQSTRPLATLHGHEARITTATFAGNGLLATGDDDGTIRIWDLANIGKDGGVDIEPVVIQGHRDTIPALAFGFDDAVLISGALDGLVHIWDISLSGLLVEACDRVLRNLSTVEFDTYLKADVDYPSTCTNVPPHVSTIDWYIRQDRIDEIEQLLEQASQLSTGEPFDPGTLVERLVDVGSELAFEGEGDRALLALNYALELSPTLPIVPAEEVALGLVGRAENIAEIRPQEALDLLERAYVLEESVRLKGAEILVELAQIYVFESDPDEALALLNRAQEWDPEMFDDVDLPEDGDEPITAPERMLVDLLVENVSLFMLIGGQAEDSLAMILYAIELFPPAIEYLEDILPIVALQYASDGRLDDIVSRLQEFSAENPELEFSPEGTVAIGAYGAAEELADTGQIEEALAALAFAVEHVEDTEDLDESDLFNGYNTICSQIQDDNATGDAILACEQAASLAETIDNPFTDKSVCMNARGPREVAIAVLPACERYFVHEMAQIDILFQFTACPLADIPGYEKISQEACRVLENNVVTLNSKAQFAGSSFEPAFWLFSVSAGQNISITFSSFEGTVEIYSPGGQQYYEDYRSLRDPASRPLKLLESGSYLLVTRSAFGLNAATTALLTEEYQLIIEDISEVEEIEIEVTE